MRKGSGIGACPICGNPAYLAEQKRALSFSTEVEEEATIQCSCCGVEFHKIWCTSKRIGYVKNKYNSLFDAWVNRFDIIKSTGIIDKNGIPINLGDTVRFLFCSERGYTGTVVWNGECAKFQVRVTDDMFLDFGYVKGDELEVILDDEDPRKNQEGGQAKNVRVFVIREDKLPPEFQRYKKDAAYTDGLRRLTTEEYDRLVLGKFQKGDENGKI